MIAADADSDFPSCGVAQADNDINTVGYRPSGSSGSASMGSSVASMSLSSPVSML
jgi:hypothetical protein